MQVCVIGSGNIGLVTGACLAHIGHQVICVAENNETQVKLLQTGDFAISEPGLDEMIQSAIARGDLAFTSDLAVGVTQGEIIFITLDAAEVESDEGDTAYLEALARSIASHLLGGYKVIVNRSNFPIGAGDLIKRTVEASLATREVATAKFDVVSNPEFVKKGSAVADTLNPDRLVLGSNSLKAIAIMQKLYQPIVERQFAPDKSLPAVPVVVTDLGSAETIKYATNSFLATKISFMNEVANICNHLGADVSQVAQGVGLDSRIGYEFLQAGIGWGDSSFPEDVSALVRAAAESGYKAKLLKAVETVNQEQKSLEIAKQQKFLVIAKLEENLKTLKGRNIGLLGLSSQSDPEASLDALALELIRDLPRLGAEVKAYDPHINKENLEISVVESLEELADRCDALVFITDCEKLSELALRQLASKMPQPVIIDAANCFNSVDFLEQQQEVPVIIKVDYS